ncbi:hypothetical protein NDN08_007263 [Rhodosorus marinus]|uniref:Protochlorophyllide reductase n=1 Tax=Rhodosorus marinus TaxID=101924 RepID=A0AAV8UJR1_9RHOD|nr:hypothetical protein NDN08_007263 [Rhodosorus marinus]
MSFLDRLWAYGQWARHVGGEVLSNLFGGSRVSSSAILRQVEGRPVAIVTGGTGTLGEAVCRQLAAKGYRVVLTTTKLERCSRALKKLGGTSVDHQCYELELRSRDCIESFLRSMKKFEIKLLVNNAASASPPGIFGINFSSTVVLTRGLLPSLGRRGRIVNVSSSSHLRALSGDMLVGDNQNSSRSYAASKLALLHFSRALRENGYDVVDVHPGLIWSPLMSNTLPKPLRDAVELVKDLICVTPQNAAAVVDLATSAVVPEGHYLTHRGNTRVSKAATDPSPWNALELSVREMNNKPAKTVTPRLITLKVASVSVDLS